MVCPVHSSKQWVCMHDTHRRGAFGGVYNTSCEQLEKQTHFKTHTLNPVTCVSSAQKHNKQETHLDRLSLTLPSCPWRKDKRR